MEAVFVFDPSNDLVFVKNNKLFRSKIIKYSTSIGLLCERSSDSSSSQYSSSTNIDSVSSLNSNDDLMSTFASINKSTNHKGSIKSNKFRQFRRAQQNDEFMLQSLTDQSQEYQNIIMLLLTPYAASLRLSSYTDNSSSNQQPMMRQQTTKQQWKRHRQQNSSNDTIYSGQFDENYFSNSASVGQYNKSTTNRPPPIDCLEDCHVSYCEKYEFIFIYMCQSSKTLAPTPATPTNSSKKTSSSSLSSKRRIMQKRIDIFARMSLLLFGKSLGSMRRETKQTIALRQLFDDWFNRQNDTMFLIEALERLIISDNIKEICHQSMQSFLNIVRQSTTRVSSTLDDETYTHAMLFSDTKLITSSSCRNCRSINNDDMLMIVMLLRVFNSCHNAPLDIKEVVEQEKLNQLINTIANNELTDNDDDDDADDEDEYITAEIDQKQQQQQQQIHVDNFKSWPPNSTDYVKLHNNNNDTSYGHFDDTQATFDTSYLVSRVKPHDCVNSGSSYNCDRPTGPCNNYHYNKTKSSQCGLDIFYLSDYARINNTNEIVFVGGSCYKTTRDNNEETIKIDNFPNAVRTLNLRTSRRQKTNKKHQTKSLDDQQNRTTKNNSQQTIPDNLLIFLSDFYDKSKQSILVPHMIRFIPITSGVTVVLISEVSTSSLSFHLDKILNLLNGDLENQTSSSNKVNLNLLAEIGNSVGSIKEYFYSNIAINSIEMNGKQQTDKQIATSSLPSSSLNHIPPNTIKLLIETFDTTKRQKCESLMTRLDSLMSNNVQQYLAQLVGLKRGNNPKREALMMNVRASLRDAIEVFVIRHQLFLIDAKSQHNLTQRQQIDLAKLDLMSSTINNYLDYLAVRSQCNPNLGAPYTHDTIGLNSFIYIDRSRNECIISTNISDKQQDNDNMMHKNSDNKQTKLSHTPSMGTESGQKPEISQSSSTLTSDSTDELMSVKTSNKLPMYCSDSGYRSRRRYQQEESKKKTNWPTRQSKQASDNLGSFVSFTYNRLADGHSSFSSNDGFYIYSYFLWFEDTSVRFGPLPTPLPILLSVQSPLHKLIHFRPLSFFYPSV